ncbi:MAG: hypothetical protein EOM05_12070 [Clostridia bacterium]|nr:hypothetical protein [Clostridia bacterium]
MAAATISASLAGAGGIAAGAALAGGVAGAAIQKVENKGKEHVVKEAKAAAFRDGVKEGKIETVDEIKKFADFYLATTALSYFVARCDGNISKEEELEIEYDLNAIIKNVDVPEQVRNKLAEISANEHLSFEDVKVYLDPVSIETLEQLFIDVDEIIEASDGITNEEAEIKNLFIDYMKRRKNE